MASHSGGPMNAPGKTSMAMEKLAPWGHRNEKLLTQENGELVQQKSDQM